MLLAACSRPAAETPAAAALPLRDGDIVFQTALSPHSEAIRRATHSPCTHCGVVFIIDGDTRVLEAVQTVRWTKFREWTEHGEGDAYTVRRLRGAERVLTPAVVGKMRELGGRWLGKAYDLHFGWSDERLYCSELVYELYERTTGVRLGELRKLGKFDLDDFVVRRALKERYGDNIPLDEPVISPAALFAAAELTTVGNCRQR